MNTMSEQRVYVVYIGENDKKTFPTRRMAIEFLDNIKETGIRIRWGYYTDDNPHRFVPVEDYTL